MHEEFIRNWFKDEVGYWGDYLGQYGRKKDWDGEREKVLNRPVMRFCSMKKEFYSRLDLDKDTKLLIKFFNSLK